MENFLGTKQEQAGKKPGSHRGSATRGKNSKESKGLYIFGFVIVASVTAFAGWAFLSKSEQVETRMDADRAQIELKESRFDRDWEEAWNMRGSNSKRIEAAQARVEAAERKVAELEAAKTAAKK